MNTVYPSSLRTGVRLRGDLQITITNVQTQRERRFTVRNTITYDGLNTPLFLWAPDGVTLSDYAIAQLRAGESTVPPSRGDVGLGSPFVGAVIVLGAPNRTRSTATGEVVITAQFGTGDANGAHLTEAGLFLGNGSLFARQIHPRFDKTSAFVVAYNWRLAVTA
jgi:hypothetical protein